MKETKTKTKAEVLPTVRPKQTTIVGKEGDSVTIEIRNLPNDFSFAYTFFMDIEQEVRLLKREIDSADKNRDKVTASYLTSAIQFLNEQHLPKNFYEGGCSIPQVLDAIQILAFNGNLLFSNSVASCVRNRIDTEIAAINQEYEYCELAQKIASSELIDQVIIAIRDGRNEDEAIANLQSRLSLTAGEAEFICNIPLSKLTSSSQESSKRSMKFLLDYLKHLKTINA